MDTVDSDARDTIEIEIMEAAAVKEPTAVKEETGPKDKKVGIIISNSIPLFSNGLIQNAYYLFVCLEHNGFNCQLLCYDENPSPFTHKSLTVKTISTNPAIFDPADYCAVITVTSGIGDELYTILKKNKVAVIGFVCGNGIMMDQETFYNEHKACTFVGKQIKTDEIWVIPSLSIMLDYLEVTRGAPAFVVPHLWSPECVNTMMVQQFKKSEELLFYNITKRTNKKINIIILEPNLHILKNSWLPIVAAEKLHKEHPDLIEHVFVFNYPSNKNADYMLDALSLGPKIRRFARLTMPEIFDFFNNESECYPIIVSYQLNNPLNYTYYEALHYGFPLVHNSPALDGLGYYYPEMNISKCAEQILHAYKHHDKHVDMLRKKADKYLERVDPLHPDVGAIFKGFLRSAIVNAGI